MNSSSNFDKNGQQKNLIGKTNNLNDQQQQQTHQALLLLQQISGLGGWPVQSLLQQSTQSGQERESADILSQVMQKAQSDIIEPKNQRNERELAHKRPSLIHDFASSNSNMHQNTRYSLIQPHLQQIHMSQSPSGVGIASTSDATYLSEDEEKCKRLLNERLEKIDRERTQATAMQKNAEKKAKSCEKLLAKASQEPSFMAAINENEEEEDRDVQSPTEALIERIYAENRQKAAQAAPFPPIPSQQSSSQLMAEDAARLAEEYERGLQFLPTLVQAMRIQRERRQDALERRRIIYDEQLAAWEKKVVAYEKSQKKTSRDAKHRELFEKTFIELKKMREEKERNNRVERSRFSLTQGGNGIGIVASSSTSTSLAVQSQNEETIQLETGELKSEQSLQEIDEKVYAAAIIPPVFSNPPRRFFENRNGIVENALADSRAQLETFQTAWTEAEKTVFNEKMGIYGNFAAIAAFLPTKSVKDCVHYYYMTKKRNNYKQKFSRRRKKIGRQGYRPPVMPRFGDTDESLQNYGKGCTFVACLLCESRILVLESLANQQQNQHFQETLQANLQQEMPICTKCQAHAQRNKTLNRCPLGTCICVSGKRKIKPARNLPEKFTTLGVEQKRFLIHRLKIPPSANKCCTNCFKRILKEIEDLFVGNLQSEFDAFKSKATERIQESKPSLVIEGIEEEEDMGEPKAAEMGGQHWAEMPAEGMNTLKEVDGSNTWKEIKDEMGEDEKPLNQENAQPQGSITKGTPNRQRSTLIGSLSEAFDAQAQPSTSSSLMNTITNEMNASQSELINEKIVQELASGLGILAHQFGLNSNAQTNEAFAGMFDGFTPNLLYSLQAQIQQQQHQKMVETSGAPMEQPVEGTTSSDVVTGNEARRNSESLRRKSGLATALLPSPAENSTPGNANRLTTHTTHSPSVSARSADFPSTLEKEKPLLEQQNSNLTTHSNETISKTESNQGQLSSCYESLSEDSDEDKARTETKTAKQKAATQATLPPAGVPIPTFYSLLDFQDEENAELPSTSAAAAKTTLQPDSSPKHSANAISNYFQMLSTTTSGNTDEQRPGTNKEENNPIYEPLSSDEEN